MRKRLLSYLLLPSEISELERAHLARMHRIAILFFYAHVPVLMIIAAACGTGAGKAALLGGLAVVGPTLACRTFDNPRSVSKVFGFTAMCMGGLLVHFGQGRMQIEMHFYFFVLLALLVVFAEPLVILLAAATVALHHLLLFFLLPSSVFNYQASIWTVVVHAAFVVLESTAVCFVARSFFDNVIGLERIVQRRTTELATRTREMRLVLDNVGQGFVTFGLDGGISAERSAIVETWLGPGAESARIAEYIGRADATVGAWLDLGLSTLVEDVLPRELALEQMPKRLVVGGRILDLGYRLIVGGDELRGVLLVMSDVTSQVERERSEAEQRELLSAFQRILDDKAGFLEFMAEAERLVTALLDGGERPPCEVKRDLHTLKGTSAVFGMTSLAALCHAIEERLKDAETGLSGADRAELSRHWQSTAAKLGALVGQHGSTEVEITEAEYQAVLGAASRGASRSAIVGALSTWALEPTRKRLGRIAEQARGMALRLGKGPIEVDVEANDLRLSAPHWAPFWGAFTHVVRNAIDHGLEGPEERVARGKPPAGRITLRTRVAGDHVLVEIADDGRGIDLERVAARAKERGLPHATHQDLVEALFADGLTTRDAATLDSGRGAGMSAIRAECRKLGGTVEVSTRAGVGTSIRLRVPRSEMAPRPVKGGVDAERSVAAAGSVTSAPLTSAPLEF